MAKVTPKKVNPLLKPAQRRSEQGSHAMTIINRIKGGKSVPGWAVSGAGIRVVKPMVKRRGA